MACPKNDASTFIKFLKREIFSRFGTPRVLISDGGSHFRNSQLAKVLKHYGVRHKVAAPYHPQTNEQAEVSNKEIKRILERTVTSSRKDWKLVKKVVNPGQQVLLFNSRLKLFPRKLKSKWSGPFIVKNVRPHGAIELMNPVTSDPQRSWMENGQSLKHYLGGEVERFSTVMKLVDP
ncbi:uncharacterized protein LOC106758216 [Vigna radiata var. radiata]|uniref:Uncharacterized protein LOC106758216 n=1 Tax=Vigna radiata var. radiata TaxID=3916 RepID=A0A1S3TS99_VIGRR|nr:uncharacterized protein LOC106758216 [Vigna radiata var. radiata]